MLLQALRAAADDSDHPHDPPTTTPTFPRKRFELPARPVTPADPARCHVEDGPAISVSTAQMITCTAVLSWMLHDRDGTVLDLGRRRRRPSAALRRAARERDTCRCRFPGCESRRIDLHHIQYWSHGGRTSLDNLISLCPYHHRLVHERGYLIAAAPGGTFTFYDPAGTVIPPSPALPQPEGTIEGCHDADITPDTIIPAWYGERLDLDYAIYTCFANADYQARHPGQHPTAAPQEPDAESWRPPVTEIDIIRRNPRAMSGTRAHLTSFTSGSSGHKITALFGQHRPSSASPRRHPAETRTARPVFRLSFAASARTSAARPSAKPGLGAVPCSTQLIR